MQKFFLLTILMVLLSASFVFAQDDPPPPIAITDGVAREARGSTVRGRIFFEDTGRPVKRSSFMLMRVNEGGGPGENSGLTDGNGEFVLRGVAAGKYYAVVNAPGVMSPIAYMDWSEMRGRGSDPTQSLEEAGVNFEQIVVDGVSETYVQIPARRGGAISGRVIYDNGDPAIGVRVEILRKSEGKFLSVVSNFSSIMTMFGGMGGGGSTDDRGVYRFAGLPPGEYIVVASENAKHSESRNNDRMFGGGGLEMIFGTSSLLKFFHPDVTEESDAKVLEVVAGTELSEINVVIPDRGLFNVSGKIISTKDKKPVDAKIFLEKKGSKITSIAALITRETNFSTTGDDGSFSFKEIPRGEYTVRVEPTNANKDNDYEEAIAYAYNAAANAPRPKPAGPPPPKYAKKLHEIKVVENDLSDVIIELGFGANLSGTIAVANNKPMPSMVSVTAMDDKEEQYGSTSVWNYETEGRTDSASNSARTAAPKPANNTFRMENVTPGKLFLRFSIIDSKYYVKSAQSGMVDLLNDPINLSDGDNISNIKVVIADDAGTLTGKVLNHRNEPAAGSNVLIVPTDVRKRASVFHRVSKSDLTGKFEVKLPPGEYAVILMDNAPKNMKQDDFNRWLEEVMRAPDKISLDANGSATITLKKAEN